MIVAHSYFPLPLRNHRLQTHFEDLYRGNGNKPLTLKQVEPLVASYKKHGVNPSRLADLNALLARDGFFEPNAAKALQSLTIGLAFRPLDQRASAVTSRFITSEDPDFHVERVGKDAYKLSGEAKNGRPVWGLNGAGSTGNANHPLGPIDFVEQEAKSPIANAGHIRLDVTGRDASDAVRVKAVAESIAASLVSTDPALEIVTGTSQYKNQIAFQGTARRDGELSAVVDGKAFSVNFRAGESAKTIGERLLQTAMATLGAERLNYGADVFGWEAQGASPSEFGFWVSRSSETR